MTTRNREFSPQAKAVLDRMVQEGDRWFYGLELARACGLKSGTLYPMLARLADRGLLESQWLEPERAGRPPRHAYRITPSGKAALRAKTSASTLSDLRIVLT